MSTTVVNGLEAADIRGHRYSLMLAVGVAADEAFLAMAMAPSRFPRRADYVRVSAELADAKQMFSSRGWIARPFTYHRSPPPLASADESGMGDGPRLRADRLRERVLAPHR